MKSSSAKKPIIIVLFGTVVLITLLLFYAYQSKQENQDKETLVRINDGLIIDDVKLFLKESEIINLLGEGEYIEGFGGHSRDYKELKIRIGFPDDSDNDFYGRVSSIELSNPIYSIYGIKVGDLKQESINKLDAKGYKQLEENLYINGEYIISLYGEGHIQKLKISFNDNDLRDRNY